ncbi:Vegetative incompatibility protein HET-E-1 [Colletotrichum siamense]|nr:Vegetative incompatibility protein HET-E-1 [Colletotrichum siamense]
MQPLDHLAYDSSDKDRQFLIDLKLSDPRLDKNRIERTKGGLWKDSYIWILDNEEFQRWRADSQNRLLWVRGDPGKGKTMLLCGIIDELHKEKSVYEAIYFFCQATDSNLNTASAVMRGLLYLILKKKPRLIRDLRETHDYCSRQIFEGRNAWDTLCDMVMTVLEDESFQNAVIVIDALDECVTDVDELLDFINKLSSKAVRVIVSSRNWPTIERGIAAAAQRATHVSLELNEHSVSAAVVAFIEHKVSQLAQKHDYSTMTRNLVYNTLVQNSNSTFLWAALVCQQLADNSIDDWEVELKLAEFPPGLDVLYTRMLSSALSSTNVDLIRRILAVTSVVCRPVAITELKSLLGPLGTAFNNARSLEKAVRQCGSFLTIRDNVVYFVHQSAKDFLLETTAIRKVMPEGDIEEFSNLKALIQDATRFLKQHRQVIENAPLQVYWIGFSLDRL